MPAIAVSRAFAPDFNSPSADAAARVAVSLSMLSWLTVVIALFWR
jgi:hypothetical protein